MNIAIPVLRGITGFASIVLLIMVLPEWLGGQAPIQTRALVSTMLVLAFMPFSLVWRSRVVATAVFCGLVLAASVFLWAVLHDPLPSSEGILLGLCMFGTPIAVILVRKQKRGASNQALHGTAGGRADAPPSVP